MTSDTKFLKNETVKHQPRHAVADFNVTLTADVDICGLFVVIITENNAGISPPTNTTVGMLDPNCSLVSLLNSYPPPLNLVGTTIITATFMQIKLFLMHVSL